MTNATLRARQIIDVRYVDEQDTTCSDRIEFSDLPATLDVLASRRITATAYREDDGGAASPTKAACGWAWGDDEGWAWTCEEEAD